MSRRPLRKMIYVLFIITALGMWYALASAPRVLHVQPSSSAQSNPTGQASRGDHNTSFFSFFSTLFAKFEAKREDLPEIINYRQLAHIDIGEIRRKASLIVKPYSNDEERDEVLNRLEDTEALFDEWIAITEKNIAKAESDGSKSSEEIAEAKEALREMKSGKDFIAQRMQMVKNDSFQ